MNQTPITPIDFPFATGINTKTNPVFVSKNLLRLENAEMVDEKIQKAGGYIEAGESSISEESKNQAVFTYKDNLYKIQNDNISLYRDSQDKYLDLGINKTVVSKSYLSSSNTKTSQDIQKTSYIPITSAIYQDYVTYVIFDTFTGYYQLKVFNTSNGVIEYSDNEFLQNDQSTVENIVLDIVGVEGGAAIYFVENISSPTTVREVFISFVTFTLSDPVTVGIDFFYYDPVGIDDYVKAYYRSLCAKYSNGNIFLIYRTGTEVACEGKLIVRNLSGVTVYTSPTLGSSIDLTAEQGQKNLGVFAVLDDSVPYVLFMWGIDFHLVNALSFSVFNSFSYSDAGTYTTGDEIYQTFNIGVLPETNEIILLKHNPEQTQTSGTQIAPFINRFNYSTWTWSDYNNDTNSKYTDGDFYNIKGECCLAGGVVCLSGKILFPVATFPYIYEENTSPTSTSTTPVLQRRCTIYLVDESYNVVEALYSYDCHLNTIYDATGEVNTYSYFPTTPNIKINALDSSEESVVYPIIINQSYSSINDVFSYTLGVRLLKVTSGEPTNFFSAEYNKSCYFGNARLVELSGSTISENNYFDFPQIEVFDVSDSGDLVAGENYIYTAIAKWTNGSGEAVRSATAIKKQISPTGTAVGIHITPPPFFTNKPGYAVEVYRSTNDDVSSLFLSSSHSLEELSVGNFLVVDTVSDDVILSNPPLYTNGGVVSNYPFLTSIFYTESNGRIWSITRNDPQVIQVSLPEVNTISLSTNPNDSFKVTVPAKGGDCVALADLDGKLIIFKKDYIFIVLGNPPDVTGQSSTLRKPVMINSPVGCTEPSSVVRTIRGVMFKSAKGIYLLDRSLSVEYIGAEVQAYNGYSITDAILLLEENRVKFSTDAGYILSYDYFYKEWSVEKDLYFVSMVSYKDTYAGLLSNGETYLQSADIYRRDGNNFSMLIQTPWISAGTIQSYMEVQDFQILGEYKGSHILKVSIAYDYEEFPSQTVFIYPEEVLGIKNSFGEYVWGSVAVYGGSNSNTYLFRITPNRTSCMSVSLIFEDLFQNTSYETGNSFTLSHLRVMSVIENPLYPVASSLIS